MIDFLFNDRYYNKGDRITRMNKINHNKIFFILLAAVVLMLNASCFQLNNQERAGNGSTGGPVPHDTLIGGIAHAQDYCKPTQFCSSCHGTDLRGGTNGQPACYQCHVALWTTCGQNIQHDQKLGGVYHVTGYCDPATNCVRCHGADLKGGANSEPSCYKCHGELWKTCGQNIGHDVNLGGIMHAKNYCLPYQNCTECHGVNLRGGPNGQPSCLKCHTQRKWMNCGSVQHNSNQEGASHARDLCQPFRDCIWCHGNQLLGGPNGEPSCFRCHGAKWNDCGGGDSSINGSGFLFHSRKLFHGNQHSKLIARDRIRQGIHDK